MTKRFEKFFIRLMDIEGGLSNKKSDKGGLTKYGISQRAYPDIDITNLTLDHAKMIYFTDYYKVNKIDDIKDERLAWHIFEFGVNAGIGRAARAIQRLVGAVPDGTIGTDTLSKISYYQGEHPLWMCFIGEQVKHFMMCVDRDSTQIVNLKGWALRAVELSGKGYDKNWYDK
jgi:lysozyme family protein